MIHPKTRIAMVVSMLTSEREEKKRDGICEQSHCNTSDDEDVIPGHDRPHLGQEVEGATKTTPC